MTRNIWILGMALAGSGSNLRFNLVPRPSRINQVAHTVERDNQVVKIFLSISYYWPILRKNCEGWIVHTLFPVSFSVKGCMYWHILWHILINSIPIYQGQSYYMWLAEPHHSGNSIIWFTFILVSAETLA
jgi:hypothetical protein